MSDNGQSSGGFERAKCEKCGSRETDAESLIEVKIPLTGEYWMLCYSCIDDLDRWINSGKARTEEVVAL